MDQSEGFELFSIARLFCSFFLSNVINSGRGSVGTLCRIIKTEIFYLTLLVVCCDLFLHRVFDPVDSISYCNEQVAIVGYKH